MKKKIPLGKKNVGKIGIVVAHFNEFITARLLSGCLDELAKQGIAQKDIVVAWVPGAFELPWAAQQLAKQKSVAGVICLGAVLRGETIHFELVAHGAARGIMDVSLSTGKPVIFGVIAADTVNQAYARSDEKKDNKGREAAIAVLDMLRDFPTLKK